MLHARHPLVSSLIWSLGMVAPIVLAGFLLPVLYPLDTFNTIVIPFCLWILPLLFFLCASRDLYEHITGHRPYLTRYDHNTGYHINKHTVYTLLELYASLAISIAFFLGLLHFLEPPYLLTSVLFCLCALIYVAIRLTYQLQPAYEERAANEQQIAADEARKAYEATLKPETPPNLVPLLTLATQQLINQKYVIIGTAAHSVPIYYHDDERFRHTYVIGKTGSGKSTLLRNLIAQDMYHGNGVIVLSPVRKDFFPTLLPLIPEQRADDLIYFDPHDITPPVIGLSPLPAPTGNDLSQVAGETITVLERAMGDLGVTMKPMLRNAVYALLERPRSTFTDLCRLIDPNNTTLRREVVNDPNISEETRLFWKNYETSSYYRRSYEAVQNKFDAFLRPPISTLFSSPSFSLQDEINTARRIIFLDLSQLRGDDIRTMGQLLLAQIQQAVRTRDGLPEADLIPYYLYIDELQRFAKDSEDSVREMFNEARKFMLGVTVAHPSTADIPSRLLDILTDGAGTTVALQLAAQSAGFFANHMQIRRAERTAAAPEVLQNLRTGYAYVITPSQPVGVEIAISATPPIPLSRPIPSNELKTRSKQNFGTEPPTAPVLRDQPDQPDPPKPPVPQKKKSFGITFE